MECNRGLSKYFCGYRSITIVGGDPSSHVDRQWRGSLQSLRSPSFP